MSDFMEIRAVGAELSLMRTVGHNDLILVAFRNFAKAPKLLTEFSCIRFSNVKFVATDGSGQRRTGALNEGGQGCLSEGRRAKQCVSNIKICKYQIC
jgi:hypothetical protein